MKKSLRRTQFINTRDMVRYAVATLLVVALLLSCLFAVFSATSKENSYVVDGGESDDLQMATYAYGDPRPGDSIPVGAFAISSYNQLEEFLNSTTYTYGYLTQGIEYKGREYNYSGSVTDSKPATDHILAEGKTLDGNGHTITTLHQQREALGFEGAVGYPDQYERWWGFEKSNTTAQLSSGISAYGVSCIVSVNYGIIKNLNVVVNANSGCDAIYLAPKDFNGNVGMGMVAGVNFGTVQNCTASNNAKFGFIGSQYSTNSKNAGASNGNMQISTQGIVAVGGLVGINEGNVLSSKVDLNADLGSYISVFTNEYGRWPNKKSTTCKNDNIGSGIVGGVVGFNDGGTIDGIYFDGGVSQNCWLYNNSYHTSPNYTGLITGLTNLQSSTETVNFSVGYYANGKINDTTYGVKPGIVQNITININSDFRVNLESREYDGGRGAFGHLSGTYTSVNVYQGILTGQSSTNNSISTTINYMNTTLFSGKNNFGEKWSGYINSSVTFSSLSLFGNGTNNTNTYLRALSPVARLKGQDTLARQVGNNFKDAEFMSKIGVSNIWNSYVDSNGNAVSSVAYNISNFSAIPGLGGKTYSVYGAESNTQAGSIDRKFGADSNGNFNYLNQNISDWGHADWQSGTSPEWVQIHYYLAIRDFSSQAEFDAFTNPLPTYNTGIVDTNTGFAYACANAVVLSTANTLTLDTSNARTLADWKTIDGQNNTLNINLSGGTVNSAASTVDGYSGFSPFVSINNGTIKNLTVDINNNFDSTINSNFAFGGVVGINNGTLNGVNVIVDSNMTFNTNANSIIGGIVGLNKGTFAGNVIFKAKFNNTSVAVNNASGQSCVGGVIGSHNASGVIANAEVSGSGLNISVSGNSFVGGIVGDIQQGGLNNVINSLAVYNFSAPNGYIGTISGKMADGLSTQSVASNSPAVVFEGSFPWTTASTNTWSMYGYASGLSNAQGMLFKITDFSNDMIAEFLTERKLFFQSGKIWYGADFSQIANGQIEKTFKYNGIVQNNSFADESINGNTYIYGISYIGSDNNGTANIFEIDLRYSAYISDANQLYSFLTGEDYNPLNNQVQSAVQAGATTGILANSNIIVSGINNLSSKQGKIFEGNSQTIMLSGGSVESSSDGASYGALIGTNNATIQNITFNIITSSLSVANASNVSFGLVAGTNSANGDLNNINLSGGYSSTTISLSGTGNLGSAVGANNGQINNLNLNTNANTLTVSLNGSGNVGGLVGQNSGNINTANLTSANLTVNNTSGNAGGVVGLNSGNINSLEGQYSTLSATQFTLNGGTGNVGGAVGLSTGENNSVKNITVNGNNVNISATGKSFAGGIAGKLEGSEVFNVSNTIVFYNIINPQGYIGIISGGADNANIINTWANAPAIYHEGSFPWRTSSVNTWSMYGLSSNATYAQAMVVRLKDYSKNEIALAINSRTFTADAQYLYLQVASSYDNNFALDGISATSNVDDTAQGISIVETNKIAIDINKYYYNATTADGNVSFVDIYAQYSVDISASTESEWNNASGIANSQLFNFISGEGNLPLYSGAMRGNLVENIRIDKPMNAYIVMNEHKTLNGNKFSIGLTWVGSDSGNYILEQGDNDSVSQGDSTVNYETVNENGSVMGAAGGVIAVNYGTITNLNIEHSYYDNNNAKININYFAFKALMQGYYGVFVGANYGSISNVTYNDKTVNNIVRFVTSEGDSSFGFVGYNANSATLDNIQVVKNSNHYMTGTATNAYYGAVVGINEGTAYGLIMHVGQNPTVAQKLTSNTNISDAVYASENAVYGIAVGLNNGIISVNAQSTNTKGIDILADQNISLDHTGNNLAAGGAIGINQGTAESVFVYGWGAFIVQSDTFVNSTGKIYTGGLVGQISNTATLNRGVFALSGGIITQSKTNVVGVARYGYVSGAIEGDSSNIANTYWFIADKIVYNNYQGLTRNAELPYYDAGVINTDVNISVFGANLSGATDVNCSNSYGFTFVDTDDNPINTFIYSPSFTSDGSMSLAVDRNSEDFVTAPTIYEGDTAISIFTFNGETPEGGYRVFKAKDSVINLYTDSHAQYQLLSFLSATGYGASGLYIPNKLPIESGDTDINPLGIKSSNTAFKTSANEQNRAYQLWAGVARVQFNSDVSITDTLKTPLVLSYGKTLTTGLDYSISVVANMQNNAILYEIAIPSVGEGDSGVRKQIAYSDFIAINFGTITEVNITVNATNNVDANGNFIVNTSDLYNHIGDSEITSYVYGMLAGINSGTIERINNNTNGVQFGKNLTINANAPNAQNQSIFFGSLIGSQIGQNARVNNIDINFGTKDSAAYLTVQGDAKMVIAGGVLGSVQGGIVSNVNGYIKKESSVAVTANHSTAVLGCLVGDLRGVLQDVSFYSEYDSSISITNTKAGGSSALGGLVGVINSNSLYYNGDTNAYSAQIIRAKSGGVGYLYNGVNTDGTNASAATNIYTSPGVAYGASYTSDDVKYDSNFSSDYGKVTASVLDSIFVDYEGFIRAKTGSAVGIVAGHILNGLYDKNCTENIDVIDFNGVQDTVIRNLVWIMDYAKSSDWSSNNTYIYNAGAFNSDSRIAVLGKANINIANFVTPQQAENVSESSSAQSEQSPQELPLAGVDLQNDNTLIPDSGSQDGEENVIYDKNNYQSTALLSAGIKFWITNNNYAAKNTMVTMPSIEWDKNTTGVLNFTIQSATTAGWKSVVRGTFEYNGDDADPKYSELGAGSDDNTPATSYSGSVNAYNQGNKITESISEKSVSAIFMIKPMYGEVYITTQAQLYTFITSGVGVDETHTAESEKEEYASAVIGHISGTLNITWSKGVSSATMPEDKLLIGDNDNAKIVLKPQANGDYAYVSGEILIIRSHVLNNSTPAGQGALLEGEGYRDFIGGTDVFNQGELNGIETNRKVGIAVGGLFIGRNLGTIENIDFDIELPEGINNIEIKSQKWMNVYEAGLSWEGWYNLGTMLVAGIVTAVNGGKIEGCDLSVPANKDILAFRAEPTDGPGLYDGAMNTMENKINCFATMGGFAGIMHGSSNGNAIISNCSVTLNEGSILHSLSQSANKGGGQFGVIAYTGGVVGWLTDNSLVYNITVNGSGVVKAWGDLLGRGGQKVTAAGAVVGLNSGNGSFSATERTNEFGTIEGVISNWRGYTYYSSMGGSAEYVNNKQNYYIGGQMFGVTVDSAIRHIYFMFGLDGLTPSNVGSGKPENDYLGARTAGRLSYSNGSLYDPAYNYTPNNVYIQKIQDGKAADIETGYNTQENIDNGVVVSVGADTARLTFESKLQGSAILVSVDVPQNQNDAAFLWAIEECYGDAAPIKTKYFDNITSFDQIVQTTNFVKTIDYSYDNAEMYITYAMGTAKKVAVSSDYAKLESDGNYYRAQSMVYGKANFDDIVKPVYNYVNKNGNIIQGEGSVDFSGITTYSIQDKQGNKYSTAQLNTLPAGEYYLVQSFQSAGSNDTIDYDDRIVIFNDMNEVKVYLPILPQILLERDLSLSKTYDGTNAYGDSVLSLNGDNVSAQGYNIAGEYNNVNAGSVGFNTVLNDKLTYAYYVNGAITYIEIPVFSKQSDSDTDLVYSYSLGSAPIANNINYPSEYVKYYKQSGTISATINQKVITASDLDLKMYGKQFYINSTNASVEYSASLVYNTQSFSAGSAILDKEVEFVDNKLTVDGYQNNEKLQFSISFRQYTMVEGEAQYGEYVDRVQNYGSYEVKMSLTQTNNNFVLSNDIANVIGKLIITAQVLQSSNVVYIVEKNISKTYDGTGAIKNGNQNVVFDVVNILFIDKYGNIIPSAYNNGENVGNVEITYTIGNVYAAAKGDQNKTKVDAINVGTYDIYFPVLQFNSINGNYVLEDMNVTFVVAEESPTKATTYTQIDYNIIPKEIKLDSVTKYYDNTADTFVDGKAIAEFEFAPNYGLLDGDNDVVLNVKYNGSTTALNAGINKYINFVDCKTIEIDGVSYLIPSLAQGEWEGDNYFVDKSTMQVGNIIPIKVDVTSAWKNFDNNEKVVYLDDEDNDGTPDAGMTVVLAGTDEIVEIYPSANFDDKKAGKRYVIIESDKLTQFTFNGEDIKCYIMKNDDDKAGLDKYGFGYAGNYYVSQKTFYGEDFIIHQSNLDIEVVKQNVYVAYSNVINDFIIDANADLKYIIGEIGNNTFTYRYDYKVGYAIKDNNYIDKDNDILYKDHISVSIDYSNAGTNGFVGQYTLVIEISSGDFAWLDGTDESDRTFTISVVKQTINSIDVVAENSNKVYDATTDNTLNINDMSVVAEDMDGNAIGDQFKQALANANIVFASNANGSPAVYPENVGRYYVFISGLVLDNQNYDYVPDGDLIYCYIDNSLTTQTMYEVLPKTLSVDGVEKIYDGTTDIINGSLSGILAGDSVKQDWRYDSKDAGTRNVIIKAGQYTDLNNNAYYRIYSGSELSNYCVVGEFDGENVVVANAGTIDKLVLGKDAISDIVMAGITSGSIEYNPTVTYAPEQISAIIDILGKTYEINTANGFTVNVIVNSETVDTLVFTTQIEGKNVLLPNAGEYTLTVASEGNENITVTQNTATFEITKQIVDKVVIVHADDMTYTYDNTTPEMLTTGWKVAFMDKYTNTVIESVFNSATIGFATSLSATQGDVKTVGEYYIIATNVVCDDSHNYHIDAEGKATVYKSFDGESGQEAKLFITPQEVNISCVIKIYDKSVSIDSAQIYANGLVAGDGSDINDINAVFAQYNATHSSNGEPLNNGNSTNVDITVYPITVNGKTYYTLAENGNALNNYYIDGTPNGDIITIANGQIRRKVISSTDIVLDSNTFEAVYTGAVINPVIPNISITVDNITEDDYVDLSAEGIVITYKQNGVDVTSLVEIGGYELYLGGMTFENYEVSDSEEYEVLVNAKQANAGSEGEETQPQQGEGDTQIPVQSFFIVPQAINIDSVVKIYDGKADLVYGGEYPSYVAYSLANGEAQAMAEGALSYINAQGFVENIGVGAGLTATISVSAFGYMQNFTTPVIYYRIIVVDQNGTVYSNYCLAQNANVSLPALTLPEQGQQSDVVGDATIEGVATVVPKPVAISNVNKTYDGTTAITSDQSVIDGIIGGETLAPYWLYDSKDVGPRNVILAVDGETTYTYNGKVYYRLLDNNGQPTNYGILPDTMQDQDITTETGTYSGAVVNAAGTIAQLVIDASKAISNIVIVKNDDGSVNVVEYNPLKSYSPSDITAIITVFDQELTIAKAEDGTFSVTTKYGDVLTFTPAIDGNSLSVTNANIYKLSVSGIGNANISVEGSAVAQFTINKQLIENITVVTGDMTKVYNGKPDAPVVDKTLWSVVAYDKYNNAEVGSLFATAFENVAIKFAVDGTTTERVDAINVGEYYVYLTNITLEAENYQFADTAEVVAYTTVQSEDGSQGEQGDGSTTENRQAKYFITPKLLSVDEISKTYDATTAIANETTLKFSGFVGTDTLTGLEIIADFVQKDATHDSKGNSLNNGKSTVVKIVVQTVVVNGVTYYTFATVAEKDLMVKNYYLTKTVENDGTNNIFSVDTGKILRKVVESSQVAFDSEKTFENEYTGENITPVLPQITATVTTTLGSEYQVVDNSLLTTVYKLNGEIVENLVNIGGYELYIASVELGNYEINGEYEILVNASKADNGTEGEQGGESSTAQVFTYYIYPQNITIASATKVYDATADLNNVELVYTVNSTLAQNTQTQILSLGGQMAQTDVGKNIDAALGYTVFSYLKDFTTLVQYYRLVQFNENGETFESNFSIVIASSGDGSEGTEEPAQPAQTTVAGVGIIAPKLVNASGVTKAYDGTTTVTKGSFTGMLDGDTLAPVWKYEDKNAGTNKNIYVLTDGEEYVYDGKTYYRIFNGENLSNYGVVSIKALVENENQQENTSYYAVIGGGVINQYTGLTVRDAEVNYATSKEYNPGREYTVADITATAYIVSLTKNIKGSENGAQVTVFDDDTITFTFAFASEEVINAGEYKFTITWQGNSNIASGSKEFTFTITKQEIDKLYVVVDDLQKQYDATAELPQYDKSGWQIVAYDKYNNSDISGQLTANFANAQIAIDSEELPINAGEYTILVDGVVASGENYTFSDNGVTAIKYKGSLNNATYTITPYVITSLQIEQDKKFDGAFSVTVDGAKDSGEKVVIASTTGNYSLSGQYSDVVFTPYISSLLLSDDAINKESTIANYIISDDLQTVEIANLIITANDNFVVERQPDGSYGVGISNLKGIEFIFANTDSSQVTFDQQKAILKELYEKGSIATSQILQDAINSILVAYVNNGDENVALTGIDNIQWNALDGVLKFTFAGTVGYDIVSGTDFYTVAVADGAGQSYSTNCDSNASSLESGQYSEKVLTGVKVTTAEEFVYAVNSNSDIYLDCSIYGVDRALLGGSYTGTINGNGYTLSIFNANDVSGMLFNILGGTINNLNIRVLGSVSLTGNAGLVGTNNGTISNVSVEVLADITATGSTYFGTIAGVNNANATIKNVTFIQSGNITASGATLGGIVGYNEGTISKVAYRVNENYSQNASLNTFTVTAQKVGYIAGVNNNSVDGVIIAVTSDRVQFEANTLSVVADGNGTLQNVYSYIDYSGANGTELTLLEPYTQGYIGYYFATSIANDNILDSTGQINMSAYSDYSKGNAYIAVEAVALAGRFIWEAYGVNYKSVYNGVTVGSSLNRTVAYFAFGAIASQYDTESITDGVNAFTVALGIRGGTVEVEGDVVNVKETVYNGKTQTHEVEITITGEIETTKTISVSGQDVGYYSKASLEGGIIGGDGGQIIGSSSFDPTSRTEYVFGEGSLTVATGIALIIYPQKYDADSIALDKTYDTDSTKSFDIEVADNSVGSVTATYYDQNGVTKDTTATHIGFDVIRSVLAKDGVFYDLAEQSVTNEEGGTSIVYVPQEITYNLPDGSLANFTTTTDLSQLSTQQIMRLYSRLEDKANLSQETINSLEGFEFVNVYNIMASSVTVGENVTFGNLVYAPVVNGSTNYAFINSGWTFEEDYAVVAENFVAYKVNATISPIDLSVSADYTVGLDQSYNSAMITPQVAISNQVGLSDEQMTQNGLTAEQISRLKAEVADGLTTTIEDNFFDRFGESFRVENGKYYATNKQFSVLSLPEKMTVGNYIVTFSDYQMTLRYFDTYLDNSNKVYYLIEDIADYNMWIDNENGIADYYAIDLRLTADIDFGGQKTEMLAWRSAEGAVLQFTGTFDGNGFAFKNMLIDREGSAGLFEIIGENAVVQNLTVADSIIIATGSKSAVGGIAVDNYGTIENCVFEGILSAGDENMTSSDVVIGGISAYNYGAVNSCISINRTYATVSQSGSVTADGIANDQENQGKAQQNNENISLQELDSQVGNNNTKTTVVEKGATAGDYEDTIAVSEKAVAVIENYVFDDRFIKVDGNNKFITDNYLKLNAVMTLFSWLPESMLTHSQIIAPYGVIVFATR